MNIQDYKPFTPTWEEIFEKQRELKFLYEPEAKELFENFDIDCFEDQELFKKYCWRITEELIETEEAFINEEDDHVAEELIDAMNFSIELMLLYGWTNEDIKPLHKPRFEAHFLTSLHRLIYFLGLSANCLKNRQWRRSQYLVDLLVFEERLKNFLRYGYSVLLRKFGTDEKIREAWSLKYQVNSFRIQTNY